MASRTLRIVATLSLWATLIFQQVTIQALKKTVLAYERACIGVTGVAPLRMDR